MTSHIPFVFPCLVVIHVSTFQTFWGQAQVIGVGDSQTLGRELSKLIDADCIGPKHELQTENFDRSGCGGLRAATTRRSPKTFTSSKLIRR